MPLARRQVRGPQSGLGQPGRHHAHPPGRKPEYFAGTACAPSLDAVPWHAAVATTRCRHASSASVPAFSLLVPAAPTPPTHPESRSSVPFGEQARPAHQLVRPWCLPLMACMTSALVRVVLQACQGVDARDSGSRTKDRPA